MVLNRIPSCKSILAGVNQRSLLGHFLLMIFKNNILKLRTKNLNFQNKFRIYLNSL